MGTLSVRLNKEEEKVLRSLMDYYQVDQSKIVKKSSIEMYENISDLKEIEKFEKKEKSGKVRFFSIDDVFIEKS
jgi:hypothetical protein